jgi:hypothetical protein
MKKKIGRRKVKFLTNHKFTTRKNREGFHSERTKRTGALENTRAHALNITEFCEAIVHK